MPCRRTLPAWILALPIAFCTLLLTTACAPSAAATSSPPAALLPTATTPALLATPTPTTFTLPPIATATPIPQLVTGARLGGPVSAFDTHYGPEVDQDVWNTTIDGLAVQITITPTTNAGDSSDGQDRAVIIDITNPNGAGSLWSAAQEAALVAPFLPTDAHHLRTNPGDSEFGPEHLFTSATLAPIRSIIPSSRMALACASPPAHSTGSALSSSPCAKSPLARIVEDNGGKRVSNKSMAVPNDVFHAIVRVRSNQAIGGRYWWRGVCHAETIGSRPERYTRDRGCRSRRV